MKDIIIGLFVVGFCISLFLNITPDKPCQECIKTKKAYGEVVGQFNQSIKLGNEAADLAKYFLRQRDSLQAIVNKRK